MKNIFTLLLTIIILYGCEEKYLELSPISEVSKENFYQSESDFNSAMNAAYNGLQVLNDINWKMQEVRSDNAYATRGIAGFEIDNFQLNPLDIRVSEFYKLSYSGIFRANIILDQIDNIELTETKKNQFIGQAKFIRALIYFDLVKTFGDVPLINNVVELSESNDIGRTSINEVYQSIINDLKDASNLLPSEASEYGSDSDIGRATSWAAKGILAKVNLTIGNTEDAKILLEDVIGSNKFNLLTSYPSIWSIANQNNSEVIFAIQYSNGTGNGNQFNYIFAPAILGADVNPGTGLSMSRPTAELIRAYKDEDKRKDATLSPYIINPSTLDTINTSYFRKFLADQLIRDGGQDWPILRYSDILLMHSEVLNEQNDLAGAIDALNLVRARAFDDSSELYDLTTVSNKSEMLDIILKERRLEFACENQRWFDLLRFGKAEEFLQKEIRREDFTTGADITTFDTNMKSYQQLYPIPLDEIQRHKIGALTQNTGY